MGWRSERWQGGFLLCSRGDRCTWCQKPSPQESYSPQEGDKCSSGGANFSTGSSSSSNQCDATECHGSQSRVCRSCLRAACWKWYRSQDALGDWKSWWRRCLGRAKSCCVRPSFKGSWSSSTLSCCSEGAAVPSPSFNYDPGSGRRTSSSSGRSSIYRIL